LKTEKQLKEEVALDRADLIQKLKYLAKDIERHIKRVEAGKLPLALLAGQEIQNIDKLINDIALKENILTKDDY
jgi:hypothetical protein